MINKEYHSIESLSLKRDPIIFKEILQSKLDEKYYIDDPKIAKFKCLKDSKKIQRISPNGEP